MKLKVSAFCREKFFLRKKKKNNKIKLQLLSLGFEIDKKMQKKEAF